jgi:hypothetical protein
MPAPTLLPRRPLGNIIILPPTHPLLVLVENRLPASRPGANVRIRTLLFDRSLQFRSSGARAFALDDFAAPLADRVAGPAAAGGAGGVADDDGRAVGVVVLVDYCAAVGSGGAGGGW